MQKSLRKITLILLTIVLLPIIIFFTYQFSNLSKSEEELNKIYLQQVETILYSINQYSDDVFSSWANEISIINSDSMSVDSNYDKFLQRNKSVEGIVFLDSNLMSEKYYSSNSDDQNVYSAIQNKLKENKIIVERLIKYSKSGYQKIEPLGNIDNTKLYICIFAIKNNSNSVQIVGTVFYPDIFIKRNLASKISQACGEEFVLAVIDDSNKIVHSCNKINFKDINIKKSLWLLPNYKLGLTMVGGNIEELVSQRYFENLFILIGLLLLLLVGLLLIYYNLRKELKLTQLKSDFVSNVSHELRTPLSLINMYSETLVLDRIKDENKKKEYYTVIHKETNRLTKIVNSILNFSKMESGTREYDFQNYNLLEINNEIFSTYDHHIRTKGFNYNIYSEKKNIIVFADKDAISESIINLIENAMKYSSDKKMFEINIGENEEGAFWEIEDYGVGISSDDQKKIFNKFYRVSSGLIHNSKGTGLGLSLVKQIMEAHRGRIIVKSKVGFGSKFRLQFNKQFRAEGK